MINRPYVDWKSVEEAKDNTISGKDYLVAEYADTTDDGKEVINYNIAKWYNAGDTISIPCKAKRCETDTAEKRLVKAIFGDRYIHTITESGFYMTDYDIENSTASGLLVFRQNKCDFGVYVLRNVRYWSGLPIPPDGVLTSDDAEELEEIDREVKRQKKYDGEIEKLNEFTDNDSMVRETFGYIINKGISKENKYDIGSIAGVDFHTNTFDAIKSVKVTRAFYKMLQIMIDEGIIMDDVDKLVRGGDSKELVRLVEDLSKKTGDDSPALRRRITHYLCNNSYKDDFNTLRERYLWKYKNRRDNTVKILVKTFIDRETLFKAYRVYTLLKMDKTGKDEGGSGVPEIILNNEFRLMAESFIRYDSIDSIDNVSWVFKERFGVNEDGTEYDGSETPKLVSKVDSDDYDDDFMYEVEVVNEDGSIGKTRLSMSELNLIHGFEHKEDDEVDIEEVEVEGVVGVDFPYYAVVTPPNYLMFDAKYVVYDNTNCTVVKDEKGKYITFDDWAKAMEFRQRLDKELKENK